MDQRGWTGLVLGVTGMVAGLVAAGQGAPVAGGAAAMACGLAAASALVNAQRAVRADEKAIGAELIRQAAELRAGALIEEAARPHPSESVHDPDTGLLDHRVFAVTFDAKVAAARRHLRPLSLILTDLEGALPDDAGDRAEALQAWGRLLSDTLRDSDVACRVGAATFGIICEDTAEAGAVWVAERLQIATAATPRGMVAPFRAAVATYPNHGLISDDLLRRGWEALERARRVGFDPRDRLGRVELPSVD